MTRVRCAAVNMDKIIMPVPTREEVRRGILYMILAVALFALVNALVIEQSKQAVTAAADRTCHAKPRSRTS